MAIQIQLRRGTKSQWSFANTVLASGELGLEIDTGFVKIGDGVTTWSDLSYTTTYFANNASYLNGVAANGYQTTAGLSANVASLTSNNTSHVGNVSAANVVSNAQLSANLANYTNTAGLNSLISGYTSNNALYLNGVAANGYQTTDGLAANVATLTSNNTYYVGSVSAANVVSNAQLSANLANYQTTAGLSSNVATLAANSATYLNGNTANDFNTYASNQAANAYSNAISYASNASNISNGTLAEARLPYRIDQNLRTSDDVQFANLTISGLIISGNVTVIGSNNLSVTDNMIYLNSNSTVNNPDLGFAGNYNDGSYHHAGFFRDATDGTWKVFDNYSPEPDASPYVNTSHSSFRIANFQANVLYIGNTSSPATINSTIYTGTSNNSSYLNGNTATDLRNYTDSIASNAYSNAILYVNTAVNAAYTNAMSDTLSRSGTYTGNNTFNGTTLRVDSDLIVNTNVTTTFGDPSGYEKTITISSNLINSGAQQWGAAISIGSSGGGPYSKDYTPQGTLWAIPANIFFVNTSIIQFGNSTFYSNMHGGKITFNSSDASATINATKYTGVANNALYLGGTLANGYQTTAGLSANVLNLIANNVLYVHDIAAANVVSNAQLIANLANYQTTAGLSSNVATLTANNTSYVGNVSATNVVSATQLQSNLANYQLTSNLAAAVSFLTSNNTSFVGSVSSSNVVSNAQLQANLTYIANNITKLRNGNNSNSYVNYFSLDSNGSVHVGQDSDFTSAKIIFDGANSAIYEHAGANSSEASKGLVIKPPTYMSTITIDNSESLGTVSPGWGASLVLLNTTLTFSDNTVQSTAFKTNTAYTFTGVHTYTSNLVVNAAIIAGNTSGTVGQVLTSNGSGNVYWSTVTGVNTAAQYTFSNTITFTSVIVGTANNANNLNGKAESSLNVNSAVSALTANNANNLNGKAESSLNVNSAVSALTANNANNLNGKAESSLEVNSAVYALSSLNANNAAHLNGNTALELNTYANTKANNAYSNAVSYIDSKIGTANSAITANAAAAYSNAVSYTDIKIGTANSAITANADAAYSNAVAYANTKAADAYTNATSFSSNASNISSGTLSESRLQYRMNQNVTTTNNVTFANLTITGGTVATTPAYSTDIVNKQYVDGLISGVNYHPAVRLVTNTELTPVTYNNGSSGVGATLTKSSSYSALSIDSVSVAYQDRILVKDQSNTVLNGIYVVSNTGSGSYAWVLTRALDYDLVGSGTNEIAKGDLIYVLEGSTGAGTGWIENSDVTVIGTDAITFVQFASKSVYALSSGSGLYWSAGGAYDGSAASTLAVNTAYIATLTANNAFYLGNTIATSYQLNSTLNANIASYLPSYTGFVNASSFGVGSTFVANSTQITITTPVSANGSKGSAGQVLTSNGTTGAPYWSTVSSGSGSFTNGQSISVANLQITGTISLSGNVGDVGQVLTSNGNGIYWANVSSGMTPNIIRQVFTANGTQNTFTVSGGYTANNLDIYLNGVKLQTGAEANVENGSTFTILTDNPANGSVIEVVGYSNTAIINYTVYSKTFNLSGPWIAPVYGTAKYYPLNSMVIKKLQIYIDDNAAASDITVLLNKNTLPLQEFTLSSGLDHQTFTGLNYAVSTDEFITVDVLSGSGNNIHVTISN